MTKHEAYFGRNIYDSRFPTPLRIGTVTDLEFVHFRREVIDPKLPGYTLFDAEGAYAGSVEPSYVLVTVGDESLGRALRDIAREYCRRFHQDSVLLISHPIGGEFAGVEVRPEPIAA